MEEELKLLQYWEGLLDKQCVHIEENFKGLDDLTTKVSCSDE
jgi:hypothetical protein